MITIQNANVVVVDVGYTNWAFPPGVWNFETVSRVKGHTNGWVDVSALRDGSVVTVDASGFVGWAQGPDTAFAVESGVATAIIVVGFALFIRWVFKRFAQPIGGGVE